MVTFDPLKNAKNLSKHKLDLSFGERVLRDVHFIEVIDDRMDYGETRWNGLGLVDGVVFVLTYADRDTGPHFISVRKADTKETNHYFKSRG